MTQQDATRLMELVWMVWLVLEVRRGYYLPVGPFSKLLYDLKSFKDLQQHKHSQLNQLNQLSQLQLCTKASPRSSCLYRSFIIIYHTKPLAAMLTCERIPCYHAAMIRVNWC